MANARVVDAAPSADPVAVDAVTLATDTVDAASGPRAASGGALTKDAIRRVVKRGIRDIITCYEAEATRRGTPGERVDVKFTIGPAGRVTAAAATGISREIEACIAGVFRAFEFPPPATGSLEVNYPLIIDSAGS